MGNVAGGNRTETSTSRVGCGPFTLVTYLDRIQLVYGSYGYCWYVCDFFEGKYIHVYII